MISVDKSSAHSDPMSCFRCGRQGHFADKCYAKTNIHGRFLSEYDSYSDEDDSFTSDNDEDSEENTCSFQKKNKRHPKFSSKSGKFTKKSKKMGHPPSSFSRRSGVYVLCTSTGMYYVGKSNDIDARIEEHCRGLGASCLNGNPFQVVARLLTSGSVTDLESWERNETLQRMRVHGIDKVRGWMFTSSGPLSDDERQDVFRQICEKFDLCRRCGRGSHFADRCFAKSFDHWTGLLGGPN